MPWEETCIVEQRLKFVLAHEESEETVSELCRFSGISRKTGYKWLARYRESGLDGVRDRSRAPHHCPHAMPAAVEAAVLAVKGRHPSWGARKVRAWLMRHDGERVWPAASTIGDLFQRRGLVVARRRRHRVPPRTAPFAACGAANDTWCADFKGWFFTGDGRRCEPFTLSDAHSRYLLRCQAVPATDVIHVWPILDAAFREFGLPGALRSDNGPPFASVAAGGLAPLSVLLIKAGVVPERIDPGKPQQNGRHERMHGTLKAETATPPARSLRAQARRFDAFLRVYNTERPHEALGMDVPDDHYTPSPRPYGGRLQSPHYPDHHEVRRVRRSGEIKWCNSHVYISQTLAGEPVGLVESDDGLWTVSFGPVILGTIAHDGKLKRPGPGSRSRSRSTTKD